MTYGQENSEKSRTMLGELRWDKNENRVSVEDHGIHLQSMKQLFLLMEKRQELYNDVVTLNLVEVYDDRLIDLISDTNFGATRGRIENSKKQIDSKANNTNDDAATSNKSMLLSRPKLEIRTNRDGEIVMRGVLSVEVPTFDDILSIWNESLTARSNRLKEQGIDQTTYKQNRHIFATIKVSSKNILTGAYAFGSLQFVDLASSEVIPKRSFDTVSLSKRLRKSHSYETIKNDWKLTNKSLNALRDVVYARTQYQRSVPYRNSTVTHLLQDSLESDTKVIMIACVSSDESDLQNTADTLRFAQEMRKVIVGNATRTFSIDK